MQADTAKGTRDFLPEDKVVRDFIVTTLTRVFQKYGYRPLETSILQRLEVLTAKFAAGEESDAAKEIFRLQDQGKRDLGLRFDLTVPLSRFVAQHPELKLPFKRYEVGRVFRDGPIKLGRYREFWQCDVDVIGCKHMTVDAELLLLGLDAFEQLGLDVSFYYNNRKVLQGLLEDCGVPSAQVDSVIISVDKREKIGDEGVEKELLSKGLQKEVIDNILSLLDVTGNDTKKVIKLKDAMTSPLALEGLKEVKDVITLLETLPEEKRTKIQFMPSLARGLSYYTGTVFEGFLTSKKINSSVCAGGRYDDMIGSFAGGKQVYPAVGLSFGLDVITDVIKLQEKNISTSLTEVFIIPINTLKESFALARTLRVAGVAVDIDVMGRSISKNLKYASSIQARHVLFVGEDELTRKKFKLRNMSSGEEEFLSVDALVTKFNN